MRLLKDETGKTSTTRVAFWAWSIFTMAMIVAVVTKHVTDPVQAVWTLIQSVLYALTLAIAGPRALQYLGPQAGKIAAAVGFAKRDARLPSKDDDERHGGA